MSELNKAQKQAVEYVKGPLLIVAGAGTGKTTVITEKIIHLLEKGLAKPEEILALTFTEKAAEEMSERTDCLTGTGYTDLNISTFHSFCQKILERHALDIGLSNNFKLLTETDSWLLVRKNLNSFNLDYYRPLGNPAGHIHELIKHFSKCKDELISPENYLKYAEDLRLNTDSANSDTTSEVARLKEISEAYHNYNQLLLKNAAMDFGDLIFYTVKLLETRPNILEKLRAQYKYILVDEFQDVNWAQYFLIRLLAGDSGQLTVVGDDDQSIYAFRGASVSNILRFKDDYPNCKEIVLTENYRSNATILDLAYKVIQNNNPDRLEVKLKIDKKLKAVQSSLSKTNKNIINYNHFGESEEEVRFAVEKIIELKQKNKKLTWDDFAILVRANKDAEPFLNELDARGVPFEFLASSGLYRQPIVLDAISFLKTAINHHESSAVYRLLTITFFGFKSQDLIKLTHYSKKKSFSLYTALKHAAEAGVSESGIKVTEKILSLIQSGAESATSDKPTTVLYHFLEKSGYLEYLAKEENSGTREVIRQIYHLKQFFDYINQYQNLTAGVKVRDFLEHYEYVLESGEKGKIFQVKETSDSVNILTVHTSKGLEWKNVFLVNLVEEKFPSRAMSQGIEMPTELIKEYLPEGDSHLQEERRLFYVALTRAKEALYLSGSEDYGGVRKKKPSRFLVEGEIIKESLEKNKKSALSALPKKEKIKEDKKSEFVYELPKAFSYSQIKSYSTCPYQYKLSNILHIPTGGSASFSFGQTIHGTLQDFYNLVQEMNSAKQGVLFEKPAGKTTKKGGEVKAPTVEELLEIYEKCWMGDWYESKKQRDEYYAKGKEILRIFYKSNEGHWTVPERLEGWFKIKIGNNLLHGRIDRVDRIEGGLEIIDYKTGKSKDKVIGEDKEQLLIYQIAVRELPEYKELGSPKKLTYYYINDNLPVSFLGTEKEIEKLEEKLANTMEEIKSGNFKATPSAYVCGHCDFKDICDFRA